MFSTAGYFKGIVCPFYEHGLCHRTYCHYRHNKPITAHPTPSLANSKKGSSVSHSSLKKSQETKTTTPCSSSSTQNEPQETTDFSNKESHVSRQGNEATPPSIVQSIDLFGSSSSSDNDNIPDLEPVSMVTEGSEPVPVSMATEELPPEDVEEAFLRATSGSMETEREESTKKKTSYENKGVKKTRIAHAKTKTLQVAKASSSSVTAARPKSLADEKLLGTLKDPGAVYMNRKRKARTASSNVTANTHSIPKRPRLSLVTNSKVSTKIRQGYLDAFIDELIKSGREPSKAYEKALQDEKQLFERSSSQMIYRNFSSHHLKSLRKETETILKERRRRSDERVPGLHTDISDSDLNIAGAQSGVAGAKTGLTGAKTGLTETKTGITGAKTGIAGAKAGLTGAKTGLTGTKTGITGAKTGITGAKTGITGAKTDASISGSLAKATCGSDVDGTRRKLDSKSKSPEVDIVDSTRPVVYNEPEVCRNMADTDTAWEPPTPAIKEINTVGGVIKKEGGVSDVSISVGNLSPCQPDDTSGIISTKRFYSVKREADSSGCGPDDATPKRKKKSGESSCTFESLLTRVDKKHLKRKMKRRSVNKLTPTTNQSEVIIIDDTPTKTTPVCDDSPAETTPTCDVDLTTETAPICDDSPTETTLTYDVDLTTETTPIGFSAKEEKDFSVAKVRERKGSSEGSSSFLPPSPTSLINLTELAERNKAKPTTKPVKPVKRKFEVTPPKPRPPPSFSIIKRKEPTFNIDLFYNQLLEYGLSEEQLVDNGYPRPTEEVGVASVRIDEQSQQTLIEPVGQNAVRHYCCRCHKPFIIYNNGSYQSVEECLYHYGRLYKSREYGEGIVSQYSCCGERRSSPGCQVAQMHVTAGEKSSTLEGCVQSAPPPSGDYVPMIYALDCEMCYTTRGLELTRVTLVDWTLKTVYESLVKPDHPIVDYNTRFSGLKAEDFLGVSTTLSTVHEQLLSIVYEDTILIGHSLDSDLKALKFIHSTVVDTAIVFPHRKGAPFKRNLKGLAAEFLQKFIQDDADGGHDSREDSTVCMELMMMKVKSDLKQMKR